MKRTLTLVIMMILFFPDGDRSVCTRTDCPVSEKGNEDFCSVELDREADGIDFCLQ